jgi:hypothetical protein
VITARLRGRGATNCCCRARLRVGLRRLRQRRYPSQFSSKLKGRWSCGPPVRSEAREEAPAGAERSSVASSSYGSDSATVPICRIKPNWSSMFHDSAILPPSMR